MPFRYRFQPELDLLLVTFEGDVTPEEEQRALLEVARDPLFDPEVRILVDKTRARMLVGPEHVLPQAQLARATFQTSSKPKLAIVAPNDYDYGMSRMLELRTGEEAPHQITVHRTLDSACEWLELEPAALRWP